MFGQYAAFIIPAYGVSFAVIAAMTVWIAVQYRARLREIDMLEQKGIKRRSARAEAGQD